MPSLILFCVLQFLDGLTTLVFLRLGVSEGNPLVQLALGLSANPLLPIALLKAAGCGLAVIAWRSRRLRALRIGNIVFALCVLWNLASISTAA
jgi:hypothetical protein